MTYAIVYDRDHCIEDVMNTAPSIWVLATAIAADDVEIFSLDEFAVHFNDGECRREDMRIRFINTDLNVEALRAVKFGRDTRSIVDIIADNK